ncbi:uncharacterized protein DEA37_0004462 [Paragonimus westermani]|uniref:Uncharacterized protein n=1 Tax=Paragonimus westermani TaxID=34504 RepID=A0A5J4NQD2_9TREM|nr:uncharacterized protein DEA37_0004462 [Paragonimus westermani]
MCSNCRLCSFVGRELICLQNSKSGTSAPAELQEVNNHSSDSRYKNNKATSYVAHFTQIIRQELLYFCENTTIRGLPRIVRAHSRPLRLLWSTLVCSLVIGCAMCLFFLSRQYLEYNVIHPPRVLRHTSSPFPSVTVCNLRPISPDGLRYLKTHGLKTPRQFAINLADYTKYLYFNSHRKEEYFAASAAFSLAGFLESLPNDEVRRNLGYLYDKLIIKCQVGY